MVQVRGEPSGIVSSEKVLSDMDKVGQIGTELDKSGTFKDKKTEQVEEKCDTRGE